MSACAPLPKLGRRDMDDFAERPEKLVGALASGLAIVRYLAVARAPVGASRIARHLELNSSTCHNLLKTLVHERLVVFDESNQTYCVGLGVVELAKGALEAASYVRLVQPQLEPWRATTRSRRRCGSARRTIAWCWSRVPTTTRPCAFT